MQANQQLQQQIDTLQQEASSKATISSNQAQALEAEKTALQQELNGLSQKLKAAEIGNSELQEQQDQWKSKCSKYQQVWSPTKYISTSEFCFQINTVIGLQTALLCGQAVVQSWSMPVSITVDV